jgi:alkanesulfonate monooxygenase SsuD/methylene tetrahydromethanopterin reductase-like flavin-dependent oxidoreductase (luciferase family)
MTDTHRLEVGLNLPTWPRRDGSHASWPEIRRLALDAEALGVDTLWVPDHLLRRLSDRPVIGFWECWTILAAVAEATTRVGIGPFVACAGFRNPALLAKMASTLDEVSGGRLVLGLGSGVPARDASWRAFGFAEDRPVARYAEAAEVVARVLREEEVTFEGRFFRTAGVRLAPPGPRPGGPPIWVAALGERTARVAARWGDAINVNRPLASGADMDAILAVRALACQAEDRDPGTLALTGWGRLAIDQRGTAVSRDGNLAGSPGEVAEQLRTFAAAGLAHVTLYPSTAEDAGPYPALTAAALERLAPFLEALRAGG